MSVSTNDKGLANLFPRTVTKPDIARNGAVSNHNRTYRLITRDIEECWVPSFVGLEVRLREGHGACTAVVVNRNVGVTIVARSNDALANKAWGKRAIASLSWNVVDAISRWKYLPRQEAISAFAGSETSRDHRTMLVAIPRKQVRIQSRPL